MRPTVLIVSYSFPPANSPAAQRTYYFAKHLPTHDIHPVVLTTSKNISSLGYGQSMSFGTMEVIDTAGGARVNHDNLKDRKNSRQIISNSIIKKAIAQLLIPDRGIIWLRQALKLGSTYLENNHDVACVFASAPSFTNLIIACILSKRFNKKLILDFRDFYYTNASQRRIFPLYFLDKWLERLFIKRADHLIFISKRMKKKYDQQYSINQSQSSLIYNGFDNNDYKKDSMAVPSPDILQILFAGSLYLNTIHERNIFLLLDLLAQLHDAGRIDIQKIRIDIAADMPSEYMAKIKEHKLGPIVNILGIISRDEVLIKMNQANLLLHILGNSKEGMSAIPIKTFEYMATQKPILFFIPKESEIDEMAVEHKLGYICYLGASFAEQNIREIERAYKEIILDKKTFLSNSTQIEKFKREYQAGELAEIIKKLTE